MPSSPHTLARQVAPIRTGVDAIEADVRLYHAMREREHYMALPLSRPPLNGLQPRTMQDATRDPEDWWTYPERSQRQANLWAGVCVAIIVGICIGAVLVEWAAQ